MILENVLLSDLCSCEVWQVRTDGSEVYFDGICFSRDIGYLDL